jgi:hypothetical protein
MLMRGMRGRRERRHETGAREAIVESDQLAEFVLLEDEESVQTRVLFARAFRAVHNKLVLLGRVCR